MREQKEGCPVVADHLPLTQAVPSDEPVPRPPWDDEPMGERTDDRLPGGGRTTVPPPMPEPSDVARRVENLDNQQQDQEAYAAAKESLEPLTPRTQMDQSGEVPRPSWDDRYRDELYSPITPMADLQYRLFPPVSRPLPGSNHEPGHLCHERDLLDP